MAYQETGIWRRAFEPVSEDTQTAQAARSRLRNAYERMRQKAIPLLEDIARWLPNFTVHDITHIDALWECADTIAGADYALTPTETFVLGGAFLYHDAAMTLAAYGGSVERLRDAHPDLWAAVIGQELRDAGFEDADAGLLTTPPSQIRQNAICTLLRLLHAERAHDLPTMSIGPDGQGPRLIEDDDIREEFAAAVGVVAASHHWSIDRVERTFVDDIRGAPSFCPGAWAYDLLKVACLLRVADASHIDSRRAPSLLAAIRRPVDLSRLHWCFQQKLTKFRFDPALGALAYSSKSPFDPAHAEAWWLAYDAVQMIDRELRAADALLATRRGAAHRFAAKTVKNAGSPAQFADNVLVRGWTPVDARVGISNVAEVIRRFGGASLYGPDPIVALRELLQNAFDAVLARRAIQELPDDYGTAEIGMEKTQDGGWRLSIADQGIGMDQTVLTRFLLDFGGSLWNSPQLPLIHPKLAASKFRPTGKYGIGFFSVFMLGDSVTVVSKPYDQGVERISVLEFANGLQGRPIVRAAESGELPGIMSTQLSVMLKPAAVDSLIRRYHANWHVGVPIVDVIKRVCVHLCVAAPATVIFRCPSEVTTLCRANDWALIDPAQLVARLEGTLGEPSNTGEGWYQHILPVHRVDAGGGITQTIGRLGISPAGHQSPGYLAGLGWGNDGFALAGVLPAVPLSFFCGIIQGTPTRLARDTVRIDASKTDIDRWATAMGQRLATWIETPCDQILVGAQLLILGGRPQDLKLFVLRDGCYSAAEVLQRIRRWKNITFHVGDISDLCTFWNPSTGWDFSSHKDFPNVSPPKKAEIWGWDLTNTWFRNDQELFENLKTVESAVLLREVLDQAWGAAKWSEVSEGGRTLHFAREVS
jgi:hypothetical protein